MNWAPGVISITAAVAVALAIRVARLRPAAITVLALAFEVVSSYGIAAAEFLAARGLNVGASWVGLSWVAVWMLLFNVVVPTAPRYAVIAALAVRHLGPGDGAALDLAVPAGPAPGRLDDLPRRLSSRTCWS